MNESIIKNLTHFEIETRDMVLKPVSICTSVSNLEINISVVADQDILPSCLSLKTTTRRFPHKDIYLKLEQMPSFKSLALSEISSDLPTTHHIP